MTYENPYELPVPNFEAGGKPQTPRENVPFQAELQATWGWQRDQLPSPRMQDRSSGWLETIGFRPVMSNLTEHFQKEFEEAKAKTRDNPDGSRAWTNARGQVIRVDQPGGATKRYSYDEKGNLKQIDHWLPGEFGNLAKVVSLGKNKDGTWQMVGADGQALDKPWKGEIKVNPDGSTLAKGADGTSTFCRTDGSSESKNRDGSVVSRNRFGQISKITPPAAADRPPAGQPGRSGDARTAPKAAEKPQAARKAEAQAGSGRPAAAKGGDAPSRQKPLDVAKRPKDTNRAGSDRKKVDPHAPIKVQKLADGSKVAHFRNGDKVTTYAKPTMAGVRRTIERKDGSHTDEYIDGHKSTVNRDGTKIFEYPQGNHQGVVKQIDRPDGSSFSQWKDGAKMTVKPDNDPPQMVSRPDGTDTYYFRDQSRLELAKDGTLTRVNADGTSEQLPGTFIREELRMTYRIGQDHDN